MTPYSNGFPRGRNPFQDDSSVIERFGTWLKGGIASLLFSFRGKGPRMLIGLVVRAAWQIKRNLTARRLFSFPHLLVLIWMLVLLRGERWIFHWKVDRCQWNHWEKWPRGATPHHLIFIADPQIIDPHSYPGRPWPINDLTVLITDNYLRRGYNQLQSQLRPDSLFFLGDLFDGGREWKTAQGDFKDPSWARPHPKNEAKHVKSWNKKYGNDYWLQEYARFSDIFFTHYGDGGVVSGEGQRGRKLVASLPGNHDLGFGSMVKVPVRDRFSAYFGEPNRVDIIGNHSIVSVDTVSLSADTSEQAEKERLEHIYGPAEQFLKGVKAAKRRAVEQELKFWRGDSEISQFEHAVDDAAAIKATDIPEADQGESVADFPTILLTHVPLYRPPGAQCGPMREHWPPSKDPQKDAYGNAVDHRNAISVSAGYQYQNVLSEEDSIKLISSVGNVKHVFSGDDHDYCELVHNDAKENVREITVKSMSMAMGVPTPGFLMVSLWNPVGTDGKPLSANEGNPGPDATMQIHLCLLPTQLSTYFGYIYLGLVCMVVLAGRAFLIPILNLQSFRLAPEQGGSSLPLYKDKLEDKDSHYSSHYSGGSSGSYAHALPARTSSLGSRGRAPPAASPNGSATGKGPNSYPSRPKRKHSKGRGPGRWGWGETGGPRINLQTDFYDGGKARLWRASGARQRMSWRSVWLEFVVSFWRVVWMAGLFWAYLNYKG